jgi:hypothetical protein
MRANQRQGGRRVQSGAGTAGRLSHLFNNDLRSQQREGRGRGWLAIRGQRTHGFEYGRTYPSVAPAGVLTFSTPDQPDGLLAAPSSVRRYPLPEPPGEDRFAAGGEFEEGAVGEVGAGAVDLQGRVGGVGRGDDVWACGNTRRGVSASPRCGRMRPGDLEAGAPEVDVAVLQSSPLPENWRTMIQRRI